MASGRLFLFGYCIVVLRGEIYHMDAHNYQLPQDWVLRKFKNRLRPLFCHLRSMNPSLVPLPNLIPLSFFLSDKMKRKKREKTIQQFICSLLSSA